MLFKTTSFRTFLLITVPSFALFWVLGAVISGLPLAIQAFDPSPLSLWQLCIIAAAMGAYAAFGGRGENGIVAGIAYAVIASLGLILGVGAVSPMLLWGFVFLVYGTSYALMAVWLTD